MTRTDRIKAAVEGAIERRRATLDADASPLALTIMLKLNAAGHVSVIEFERRDREDLADLTATRRSAYLLANS